MLGVGRLLFRILGHTGFNYRLDVNCFSRSKPPTPAGQRSRVVRIINPAWELR